MPNPLHAEYYADNACHQIANVVLNEQIAQDTFLLRFRCPELASRILPGQFLMIRIPCCDDPLIGRPLALFDVVNDCVDVVYLVGGKMTKRLARLGTSEQVEVWGPLGNGFVVEPTNHIIMVAGGIGYTPFLALGKQLLGRQAYGMNSTKVTSASKVTFCYGARTSALLTDVAPFHEAGIQVRISTDDGSYGHRGLVTDTLVASMDDSDGPFRVVCCGPERMMGAVSKICRQRSIPCQVSLETPMACGIGICFTCVAKVRDANGDWDYKRTCVEGPVFDAEKIVWE